MKVTQIVFALSLALQTCLGYTDGEVAPDRFILKYHEKKDYLISPFKVYEIYVPIEGFTPNRWYWIRQNFIGPKAVDTVVRRKTHRIN